MDAIEDHCATLLKDYVIPYVPNSVGPFLQSNPVVAAFAIGTLLWFLAITIIVLGVGTLASPTRSNVDLLSVNRSIRDVKGKVGNYSNLFNSKDAKKRKEEYSQLVDNYYNLATDFYLFGWGKNFHFAPRHKGESLDESIRRHEFWMASRLGLKEGMKALDCGCGVGGPARNIARFSRAHVTGISLNAHQIELGKEYTRQEGLSDLVDMRQGDFMDLPFPNDHFDAVYAIEATCHAPDRQKCFSEIYRVLKPGGYFAAYEWVLGKNYDPNLAEHQAIKYSIELGNGLPDLTGPKDCQRALKQAGFEVDDFRDLATDPGFSPVPWYQPFFDGWLTTPWAITITNKIVAFLETIRILPTGTHLIHSHLAGGAEGLVEGGKRNLFTPMLFILAQKPPVEEQGNARVASSATSSGKQRKASKSPRKSRTASAKKTPARAKSGDDSDNESIASTVRRRHRTPKKSPSSAKTRTPSSTKKTPRAKSAGKGRRRA